MRPRIGRDETWMKGSVVMAVHENLHEIIAKTIRDETVPKVANDQEDREVTDQKILKNIKVNTNEI